MRVLLAENDAVSRKAAQLMLERLGHQVDIVPNGLEATYAVQRVHYDLVIMDDRMPVMSGSRAVQVIRDGSPLGGQPVVLAVSADDFGAEQPTGSTAGAAGAAGVDLFLPKPVRLQQLREVLDLVAARVFGR